MRLLPNAAKLRQLVEEEDAEVGEANLANPVAITTATRAPSEAE